MATLVSFHAHPDDESIATGGTMAKAKAAGTGWCSWSRPGASTASPCRACWTTASPCRSAAPPRPTSRPGVLGVDRVEFLGYVDSGMVGTPTNEVPWSFWQTALDQAAARLAAILGEEQADVLTIYDDNGGYGHPDHIQVHRVGSAGRGARRHRAGVPEHDQPRPR